MIFTWKILSMGMCFTTGYAAVAHFGNYPVFGVMYYGILFDVSLFYAIPYEKAFKVPGIP